jgi:SET domain-containing protein
LKNNNVIHFCQQVHEIAPDIGTALNVIEARFNEKKFWFDCTRRTTQFGSYINHSITPNSKLMPPVHVRGKLRIGFVSTQPIKKGDEVTWDYGDRNPSIPWLSGKGKFIIVLVISASSEQSPPPKSSKKKSGTTE